MSEEIINSFKTAEILGISQASIRNWLRHGYLQPVDREGKHFLRAEVLKLKADLSSGKIDRLRSRANKARAEKKFLPVEYLRDEKNLFQLSRLSEFINSEGIDVRMALLVLALNLFSRNGDLQKSELTEIILLRSQDFSRKAVYAELQKLWKEIPEEVKRLTSQEALDVIFKYPLPQERDVLGLIYQSLMREGRKASLGSYFTPPAIVDRMVRENFAPGQKVLDPCCGTGQFLLACADYLQEPEGLFGLDIDWIAVWIARINLLLKFPQDFSPNILVLNPLKDLARDQGEHGKFYGSFDLVITNPPWGAGLEKDVAVKLNAEFPGIISSESFAAFLLVSLELLRDGGRLSFVLPEAILNIRKYAALRKHLVENWRIRKIECLGKRFKNVFSSAIRLELEKAKPCAGQLVLIKRNGQEYQIAQQRFLNNKWYVFDVYLNEQDERILNKVYQVKHLTLKDNADWALGIVTGDNRKFLQAKPLEGYEPIYRGLDVTAFKLKKPSAYIRFEPELMQQVAPLERYRAKEKLIYKFISKRPVFAYDDRGSLTLNSANILIPKLDYPLKVILGLFNSSLYAFIYRKKFHTLKILRGDLEQLPLPLWDKEVLEQIASLVDQILQGNDRFPALDDYILDQFGFTSEEKKYIRFFVQAD
ncbi:MAG TPA: N-6 DNA methylase [Peptococcaceae bacterium]|nr:N-6 DNA methylase [Peptococcaceae bacterium]